MQYDKIPLFVILLVILFILILVVVIASYTVKDKEVYPIKTLEKEVKEIQEIPKGNNIRLQLIEPFRISDSWTFIIDKLEPFESYIFGAQFFYSTVSVYVDKNLYSTQVINGNRGIVLSSNLHNINASYFQIGKTIPLENIQYGVIPIPVDKNEKIQIIINNVPKDSMKVFKCNFDYHITEGKFIETKSIASKLGLSEYDLELVCQEKLKEYFPLQKYEKVSLQREIQEDSSNLWSLKDTGIFVVFYIDGLYSLLLQDSEHSLQIQTKHIENKTSILTKIPDTISLQLFQIQDPNLIIRNQDETIELKDLHSDLNKLFHTPTSLYEQFVYGKKQAVIDIWNRIHNKILVYKRTE